jgi:hypothetical protein
MTAIETDEAKEKAKILAKEVLNKNKLEVYNLVQSSIMRISKKYALIEVNKILESHKKACEQKPSICDFWNEVKKEINKL